MLEVESLYWSTYEVIAANKFFLVVFIFFVDLSHRSVLVSIVSCRGHNKCENGGGLFQQDVYIFLEVFRGEFFAFFVVLAELVLFDLGFRVHLALAAGHVGLLMVHGAAIFHF